MNIKIHSSELNRMLRIVSQCIDQRFAAHSNIEIVWDNNLLTMRGTNGSVFGTVSSPLLGGDGESFSVDGTMLAKVCSMCSGEVEIRTDSKSCVIKGAGRTRLPIVNANVAKQNRVTGKKVTVSEDSLSKGYNSVAYAVSADQSRIQLTGVLAEVENNCMRMVALDGFQMSMETIECDGDDMKVIIPGSFLKLVIQGAGTGEQIMLCTDGTRMEASTDSMILSCGLLAGEYPDYNRIMPTGFKTECMVNADELMSALKSGSVINSKQNLVKLEIADDSIMVRNNSEEADYEADVPCEIHGYGLKIAFNQKYLLNTINAISTGSVVMKFISSVSPCILQGKGEDGIRLLLPVRVQG